MPADTYEMPKHGWTCFHCGETFTTVGSARDHFGYTQFADPGCIIDKVAVEEGGKPERGRGLLMALRKAEAELARYREEDTDLHRALHAKECERATAVQRAEEQGYARGLADGHRFPEDAARAAGAWEYCWLVALFHRGDGAPSLGRYHTGLTDLAHQSRTTVKAHEAKRYTKAQAEQVAKELNQHMMACEWRAVEHGFRTAHVAGVTVLQDQTKPLSGTDGRPGATCAT